MQELQLIADLLGNLRVVAHHIGQSYDQIFLVHLHALEAVLQDFDFGFALLGDGLVMVVQISFGKCFE